VLKAWTCFALRCLKVVFPSGCLASGSQVDSAGDFEFIRFCGCCIGGGFFLRLTFNRFLAPTDLAARLIFPSSGSAMRQTAWKHTPRQCAAGPYFYSMTLYGCWGTASRGLGHVAALLFEMGEKTAWTSLTGIPCRRFPLP